MTITVGSLFSGYEGIHLGLTAAGIEHRTLWTADNDKAATTVLTHRLPHTPNLGDVTAVDWRTITTPDLLTGGFPCTDVSSAGLRQGITPNTRSGLWNVMARAIHHLRPRWVLIENVRGLLHARADSDVEPCPWCLGDRGGEGQQPVLRALGAVLGDLSDLGYDTKWVTVAASDIGAAHRRERVFIIAWRAEEEPPSFTFGGTGGSGVGPVLTLLPTPAARDWKGPDARGDRADGSARTQAQYSLPRVLSLLPTPRTSDSNGSGQHGDGGPEIRTAVTMLPTPRSSARENRQFKRTPVQLSGRHRPCLAAEMCELLPTPRASDGEKGGPNQRGRKGDLMLPSAVQDHRFGTYGPAVARWADVLHRPAPDPTEAGKNGHRLSPRFVEWLMGLPEGWVTDLVGKSDALRLLGNGVVPQQLAHALRLLA